jgi:hypothetical protein
MSAALDELSAFIVAAKAATYAGGCAPAPSCRLGSHDLAFASGEWRYLDSYFGGADFLGQEAVWRGREPVWAMNYYGRILRADLIDAARAGAVIKASLSALYIQGRFLGGFEHQVGDARYVDATRGDVASFHGVERIFVGDSEAYRLDYFGGLVKA